MNGPFWFALCMLNALAGWLIGWNAGYDARKSFEDEMTRGSSDSRAPGS